MKTICNACGKYKEEIDEFGYCKKCSNKLFSTGKHTTVEQNKIKNKIKVIIILITLLVVSTLIYIYRNNMINIILDISDGTSSSDNPISKITQSVIPTENKTLTSENAEALLKDYSDKNKDTDDFYYFSYAVLYNAFKNGIVSMSNTNSTNTDDSVYYKNIYGKTIKELIEEGKTLMKQNNVTVEQYKKSLEDLNNSQ